MAVRKAQNNAYQSLPISGSKRSLDESVQASDQKLLKGIIPRAVQSSNYTEISLQRGQLIELSLSARDATTLSPLIPCEKLREMWLENSMGELSICDRIRILWGVRIASLFGASGETVAALTVLVAGILIWNFKVEGASPQAPSHPKELSMPQYCDCSSSILHRGWGRR